MATIGTAAVEGDPSEPICVTPADTFPPAAPTGLAAVSGAGAINLIWDANTDADLAGYVVLRGEAPGDTLQPLTPEPIRETRYVDRAVRAGRDLRLRRRRGRPCRDAEPQRHVEQGPGNRAMKKFYRIDYQGTPRHAIEEGGTWRLLDGDLFGTHRAGEEIAPDAHRLLAPVLPSKMVCIGLNYKDHAAEQNKPLPASPLMFIKPSTAVDRTGGSDRDPAGYRPGGPRSGGRRRDRPAGAARCARRTRAATSSA